MDQGCAFCRIAARELPAELLHVSDRIVAFRDAGVTVTVNSDDPPMFGTSLNREYEIAADLLGLDEAGVAELARTAVRASFAEEPMTATLLAEIDAYA